MGDYSDCTVLSLTIANGAAVTEEFRYERAKHGMVLIPGAWTAANIGFQVSATSGGTFTFVEHHDSGEPIQINTIPTNLSVWKEFPPELKDLPAVYMKLWSKSSTDATETGTNQGAARTLVVVLKG